MVMINAKVNPQVRMLQKVTPSPIAFKANQNINVSQSDTVCFTGGLDSAGKMLKSKTGKLGMLGIAFLALLGLAAPKASAHTIYDQSGNMIKHEHVYQSSISVNVDRHGNWSISAGTGSRIDPGMQEYQREYNRFGKPVGWREVTRVFDASNNQIGLKTGALIRQQYPGNPDFNQIPPWVRHMMDNIPRGTTIIIPGPGHNHPHHPPHHHHHR